MSNDTIPVLEHINGEEHYKGTCCVERFDIKTVNGRKYYIFVRKCKCDRKLLSKKFWHKYKTCLYESRPQCCKPFKIEEFCTCDQPSKAYEGR